MRNLSPDRWTIHCWALILLWIVGAAYFNLGRLTKKSDAELTQMVNEFKLNNFRITGGWPFHYRAMHCNPVGVSYEVMLPGAVASATSIILAVLSLLVLLQRHFRVLSIRKLMFLIALVATIAALWIPLRTGEILQGFTPAFLWFRMGLYFSPVVILAMLTVARSFAGRAAV